MILDSTRLSSHAYAPCMAVPAVFLADSSGQRGGRGRGFFLKGNVDNSSALNYATIHSTCTIAQMIEILKYAVIY